MEELLLSVAVAAAADNSLQECSSPAAVSTAAARHFFFFFLQVQGLQCLPLCFSELDRNCVTLLFPTGQAGVDTLCRGSALISSPPVTDHASESGAQGERLPGVWWVPHRTASVVYFPFRWKHLGKQVETGRKQTNKKSCVKVYQVFRLVP